MNFTIMPSLQHIALVKIATTLWNKHIRALLKGKCPMLGGLRNQMWREIEDKVVEKVPQLSQPKSLNEKITNFVRTAGRQMLKWFEYHFYSFPVPLPNFYWTPEGTIDRKKTAQAIIKDENSDISKRYEFACLYCFEDDILELWNKMPEDYRNYFYDEEFGINISINGLVNFWSYSMNGKVAKLNSEIEAQWQRECSYHEPAFHFAVMTGNKAATQYFFPKLTATEREEFLFRYAELLATCRADSVRSLSDRFKINYAEVLCFLLSQMEEEQQIKVFKSYPLKVLESLLDWPWQNFFLETANHVWDSLSEKNFESLLFRIINRVREGYTDCNYRVLFGKFWKQSPDAYKRYVIDKSTDPPLFGCILTKLLEIEDKGNVELILQDATLTQKEKIIFSSEKKSLCKGLICDHKSDLVQFFIQNCISHKDTMVKFKDVFMDYVKCCYSKEELEKVKGIWNRWFQLLDDLIHTDNKARSTEEGESS